jgi:LacI family transcriptional regulator
MQQIADRLGISKYSVSQALSGKTGVSETTRRQVIAMARALGYRSVPAAPAAGNASEAACIPPGEARLILVGFDERHTDEPLFWHRVKQGIEAGCRQRGFAARYFTFGANRHGGREAFHMNVEAEAAGKSLGVIVAGNCPAEALLQLKKTGVPLVLVDHEEPVAYTDAVLNANVEAGRMACHHLLSQGCGTIAFIGRDSYAVSFRERWWGFRIALDDLNGRRTPGYAPPALEQELRSAHAKPLLRKWTIPYSAAQWQHALARKLAAAAAEGQLPDGFVCANDDIALELLKLLGAMAVDVPAGCRVVGIDNTAASGAAPLPLTTVDLAKEWLGMRAVETLARKLEHPEAPPEKVVLPARLIVRQSG